MSNEWFIIANRFSNSGKAISLVEKAVKKLKEEKIKYWPSGETGQCKRLLRE